MCHRVPLPDRFDFRFNRQGTQSADCRPASGHRLRCACCQIKNLYQKDLRINLPELRQLLLQPLSAILKGIEQRRLKKTIIFPKPDGRLVVVDNGVGNLEGEVPHQVRDEGRLLVDQVIFRLL